MKSDVLIGTVYEVDGDSVFLEWDDEDGPQEDEVTADMLRHAVTPFDSQAPQRPHGSAPPR